RKGSSSREPDQDSVTNSSSNAGGAGHNFHGHLHSYGGATGAVVGGSSASSSRGANNFRHGSLEEQQEQNQSSKSSTGATGLINNKKQLTGTSTSSSSRGHSSSTLQVVASGNNIASSNLNLQPLDLISHATTTFVGAKHSSRSNVDQGGNNKSSDLYEFHLLPWSKLTSVWGRASPSLP
ncbi:unnamed protein product, partial [Amoebophrya sp. A120]